MSNGFSPDLDAKREILVETLDDFQDGIIALDNNWNFTYLNKRAAEIIGFKPTDLIGKNLWRVLPKVKGTLFNEKYRLSKQYDVVNRFETKSVDGKKWFEVTIYPSKKGIIVHWHDITQRKKAQEVLDEERIILKGIIENAGAMIAYLDLDFNFVVVNSAYANSSGYSIDELIGKNHFTLFPNKDNQAIFEKVRNTGEPVKFLDKPFEYANQPNRGVTYWDWTLSPVKDTQGKVQGVILTLIETTERKKIEEALMEANKQTEFERKRLEVILDAIPSAVVILEAADGKISYANRRATQLYGFDAVGLDLATYIDKAKISRPDGSRYLLEDIPSYRSLKYGIEIRHEEMIVEHPNGTRLSVLVSSVPLFDAQSKITAVIIAFDDITERKKVQQQLESEKALLDLTISQMPYAVAIADAQTNQIVVSNKQFQKVWGFPFKSNMTLEEFAQTYQIYHLDNTRYTLEERPLLRSIKQGEVITQEEAIFYRKDGSAGFLQISSAPIKEAGKIVGSVFIHNDVTERKMAEEAIRRQAELIDLSPDAIIVRKLDGTITFWSKGAEKLYGWTKNEAIGQKTDTLLSTKFPKSLEDIFSELRRTTHWTGELTQQTKNNLTVTVQSYWLAIFRHSEIAEIFESHVDITERKKLQKKLEEYSSNMERLAQERLEKLKAIERLATIGQVAGMVGHDIRNPLQAIDSELYLVKTTLNELPKSLQEVIKESVNTIENQTQFIEKIVQDLQDLAKPLKPELVEVDLCSAVPDAVSTVKIPSNIQSSIACDVPPLNLKIDMTFLRRIMVNLVTNAIQAMPNGGKLTIRVFRKGDKAVITVKDTGVGIPKEVQQRMFTPLFTTKDKGQGFGMVAVKRMTEALGGTITFKSQEGKGTKFTIELPASTKS